MPSSVPSFHCSINKLKKNVKRYQNEKGGVQAPEGGSTPGGARVRGWMTRGDVVPRAWRYLDEKKMKPRWYSADTARTDDHGTHYSFLSFIFFILHKGSIESFYFIILTRLPAAWMVLRAPWKHYGGGVRPRGAAGAAGAAIENNVATTSLSAGTLI